MEAILMIKFSLVITFNTQKVMHTLTSHLSTVNADVCKTAER